MSSEITPPMKCHSSWISFQQDRAMVWGPEIHGTHDLACVYEKYNPCRKKETKLFQPTV